MGLQCDAIAQHFELQTAEPPEDGLTAFITRPSDGQRIPVFSFVPPVGGMFVWQKYHLAQNDGYLSKKAQQDQRAAVAEWSVEFWKKLIENKVLLTPGSYYEPWQGKGVHRCGAPDTTYMRLAFSYEGKEDIEKGIERMAMTVKQLWNTA